MAQTDIVFDKWGILTFTTTLFIVIAVATIIGMVIYNGQTLLNMFMQSQNKVGPVNLHAYSTTDGVRVIVTCIMLLMLCICTGIIFNATLKLKTEFEVGKRKQEECGLEYPESSTGRYALFNAYNDQIKKINDALSALLNLIFISFGIMLAIDAFSLYKGVTVEQQGQSVDNSTRNTRSRNVRRGSIIAVAALMLWFGSFVATQVVNKLVGVPILFSVGIFCVIAFNAFVNYMNNKSINDTPLSMFVYTIVCVISFVLYMLVQQRVSNLSDAIAKYTADTTTIQTEIGSLLSTEYPNDPQQTIIKKHMTRNIMRADSNVNGNTEYIYHQYLKNLWPFITHRNWQELKEVATIDDSCPTKGKC